ncbi:MFS transporter [Streptomyces sp. NBC_01476]|uniref:MFS transporter n=1 Tax=Streptomyces sp. NBC_01476 TaxID=2903881 RepID=UPI002E2F3B48|nr:MFS transporter [Streptomyces sp. NBC_01476]
MASETRRTPYQVTFAVLAAGVTAYALLQSLVTPVLPTIQENLHTNQNTVTWVLTAYLLSASIFTPIMGRIGDILGKERVFVATLAALALGSLLAALATNVDVMIIARVIQGIGGGVLPLAFGIVRDEFPKEKLNGAVGAIASLIAVGAGLGIVLAGPIVNALDYHWLFWLPMILTIAAAVAAAFFIPKSPVRTAGRISWLPAVLLSAWLVALLVGLSQAPVWGWGSGKVIGLFVAAVVLAAGWVEVERRAAQPLIDMNMMRRPAVWTNNLVALLFGIGMYAVFAFLPEFVQSPKSTGYGFGASITESGLILLPMTVTMFLVGLGASSFAARIGGKTVVLLGTLIGTGSMALLAFAHTQTWELYVATAVMGIGFGLAFSAMSSLIVNAVPPEQTGVASGMNANIRTIGGSIGAALMASVVTASPAADGLPKESGYTNGFAMLGGALLIAAFAAALIPASRRSTRITLSEPAEAAEAAGPAHAEPALVPGGTVVGDKSE